MSTSTERGFYSDARYATERVVHNLMRGLLGDEAITRRPIYRTTIERDEPADWGAGIDAARRVRNYADQLVHEYACRARADGIGWDELGEVLGVPESEDDPAEAAFVMVSPEPSMRFDRHVSWRCTSCQELITDNGPYESHPTDNETGHANDCARHKADIAAWRRRTGWED